MGRLSNICLAATALLGLISSATAATVNSSELYLSEDFEITSTVQTRTYDWTINESTAAPDGFERQVLFINDQFPGPLIECNVGDTIQVTVTNNYELPVTIHWHGIFQNSTGWMDGVTGVTQCPIPTGSSMTYEYTITEQYGTFWYHAHAQNLAADGIAGPLIVHSTEDQLVRGTDYDNDVIIFMNDWFNNTSAFIMEEMLSSEGYLGHGGVAPSPNSALLNGIGQFDCSYAIDGSTCTDVAAPLEFNVAPNTKTRLRLINAGSHGMFRFSADNHTLDVIEADATAVESTTVHRVPMHNGQRYSVILDTSADSDGDSFYIRSVIDTDCFAWVADGLNSTVVGIVRVVADGSTASTDTPESNDWSSTTYALDGSCIDLDDDQLVPLTAVATSTDVTGRVVYSSSFGSIVETADDGTTETASRFFVNDVTWLTYTYQPLLAEMLSGGEGTLNASEVTAFYMDDASGTYDIVINNLDRSLDHPYHLHGVDSYIVARGSGELTSTDAESLTYNTTNPVRRDTYVIPGGSYAVIRVTANNPGVCLGGGFAGVVVMQQDTLASTSQPTANSELCDAATSETIDDIEPGRKVRRSLFPGDQIMSPRSFHLNGAPRQHQAIRGFARSSKY